MERLRPLVAGNWKMNGTKAALAELEALKAGLREARDVADIAICPPATLVSRAAVMVANSPILIGGQDCHAAVSGAHTGDISAEMVADAGGRLIIVGHSERRQDHHESDAAVRAKAEAVWRAGLLAVVCIGETAEQRRDGRTLDVLAGQLAGSVPEGAKGGSLVIAYEPVWAIGSGLTPTGDEIAAAHRHIRERLVERLGAVGSEIRVLYGGSVKPDNAAEIFALPGVNGALVGGASLKAGDFLAIVKALGRVA